MKAVYLLPCSCGEKARVDAGQAGAKVVCICGKQLSVPTFRGLKELETEAVETVAGKGKAGHWSVGRGVVFSAGMLVSVVACVLFSYYLYFYWQVREGGDAMKRSQIESLRHEVDHLNALQIVTEFQENIKQGLKVEGIPPWGQIDSWREKSYRIVMSSLTALGVGIACLLASLFVRLPQKRT